MDSISAEVKHLIVRSFGDEVIQRTIERRCLCVAQMDALSPVTRMCAIRHVLMPEAGYIATPAMARLIWEQTIVYCRQPFTANVQAAALAAPSIALKPTDYSRPAVPIRLDDDCRRLICSFIPEGTLLGFLESFAQYRRNSPGVTLNWKAIMSDGPVLEIEWNQCSNGEEVCVVKLFEHENGKTISSWTFSNVENMLCLRTAPELGDIMHLEPRAYKRSVLEISP